MIPKFSIFATSRCSRVTALSATPNPAAAVRRWMSAPDRNASRSAGSCDTRSEEHTSELQSRLHLVCRLLLEKKKEELQPQAIPFQAPRQPIVTPVDDENGACSV